MGGRFQDDPGVILESDRKVDTPKRFRIVMMNDDYTSMEFVVFVLQNVFHKTPQEAFSLMMAIHTTGRGVIGVYSREVAEMKIMQVTELARENDYPLRCIMEED